MWQKVEKLQFDFTAYNDSHQSSSRSNSRFLQFTCYRLNNLLHVLALSEYTFWYDMSAMNEKKYNCMNVVISEKTLVSRSVLDVTNFSPDFSEKES